MNYCKTSRNIITTVFIKGEWAMSYSLYSNHSIMHGSQSEIANIRIDILGFFSTSAELESPR